MHVTGIRRPGRLVADIYSGVPPNDSNHVLRQFRKAESGTVDVTLDDVPYGDYVLGVFVDENNNYTPDFGSEGAWIFNGQNIDPRLGVSGTRFDTLKFSFREPEHRFDVPLAYPEQSKR